MGNKSIWGLKLGHQNTFRRTVEVGTKPDVRKYQLVFNPDTPLELTDEELGGLRHEIELGLIVPWRGDRRVAPVAKNSTSGSPAADLENENGRLTELVASMTSEIAQLRAQLAELRGGVETVAPGGTASSTSDDEVEASADDVPLGDELETPAAGHEQPQQTDSRRNRRRR